MSKPDNATAPGDSDRERGLYRKYRLTRVAEDGTPIYEVDEPFFALRYTRDPHARAALNAYADSCADEAPQLAADMRRELSAVTGHDFLPVADHPDDDECTHRADGTDATYCGEPRHHHRTVTG